MAIKTMQVTKEPTAIAGLTDDVRYGLLNKSQWQISIGEASSAPTADEPASWVLMELGHPNDREQVTKGSEDLYVWTLNAPEGAAVTLAIWMAA